MANDPDCAKKMYPSKFSLFVTKVLIRRRRFTSREKLPSLSNPQAAIRIRRGFRRRAWRCKEGKMNCSGRKENDTKPVWVFTSAKA
jgi:hypothetical protein